MSSTKESVLLKSIDQDIRDNSIEVLLKTNIESPVKRTLRRHPNQGMCLLQTDNVKDGPSEMVIQSQAENLVEISEDFVFENFMMEYGKESKMGCESDDEVIFDILRARNVTTTDKKLKRHPSQGMCLLESDKIENSLSPTKTRMQSENLIPEDLVLEKFMINFDCKNIPNLNNGQIHKFTKKCQK